ncbi:Acyl-CoA synthetase (AMP-forming)/AMP-acid ligase II [Amycolatopsis xylanica]|uniref:Acyl-CoA synthetase (AMP-forming)/AMP-acid ligase II n=1 Tax=Amycolatopsis xylanica TaxID=589385 RepID=A0A1H2ZTH7_9PSEU|nr:non-ribosomal peptide synthetase [Amycolatopsis xylanica]SDX20607.1 Acyl-CoA synthetase (AMP-forming)/AMP-acid ligase II [Amycolatopsis xylanica]
MKIHELVAAAPLDNIALRQGDETVTYRELLAEADAIAARLPVRAGDVVAVSLPASPHLIATLLAVLSLDAVYTVIPPDWPPARAAQVLDQTRARVLVTTEIQPREVAADPADGCCVFFTSGSTGRPKAVLATHAGVLRVAFDPLLAFSARTSMLQAASTAWDIFAMEVWAPLVHGGTVVLGDGPQFELSWLRDGIARGVNTVFLTASLFNLAAEDDLDGLTGLEVLMSGGERASVKHWAAVAERHPDIRLLHGYGPAEATIATTFGRVTHPVPAELSIGWPIAETEIFLLDKALRPVPDGTPGEIAIGGPGLAAGYLYDEAETARRFRELPQGRVYLTGDIATQNPDGSYTFVGRRDRQLKVSGVRVEPSEIERVISDLPGVGSVAVIPANGGLAAFYTTVSADAPDENAARQAVAEALPSAFVPGRVVRLAELPVTETGKLDHARLTAILTEGVPAPSPSHDSGLVAEILRWLTEIAQLPADADTDIFAAGATSVTAIRLAHALTQSTGRAVPAPTIFRHRTPAAIATALTS